MRGLVIAAALLALAPRAHADALVMRTEGKVAPQVKAKLEAAVLALAAGAGPAAPGDITYAEAAVTVGCSPEDAACKDEVLGLLGVDEVVTIAAASKGRNVDVTIRRITRGGWTRTASTRVTADTADQLATIAPLFGGQPAALAPAAPVAPTPAVTTPAPTPVEDPPPVAPAPTTVAEPTPSIVVTPPPDTFRDDRASAGRLPKIGMVAGGTLALVGVVFWASAASKADEAEGLPNRTRADLLQIMDLEDQADSLAATGNVLVLAGLVVGGVSTYYYVKGRRSRAMSARITPAVFGDGAGIAVTVGGLP